MISLCVVQVLFFPPVAVVVSAASTRASPAPCSLLMHVRLRWRILGLRGSPLLLRLLWTDWNINAPCVFLCFSTSGSLKVQIPPAALKCVKRVCVHFFPHFYYMWRYLHLLRLQSRCFQEQCFFFMHGH